MYFGSDEAIKPYPTFYNNPLVGGYGGVAAGYGGGVAAGYVMGQGQGYSQPRHQVPVFPTVDESITSEAPTPGVYMPDANELDASWNVRILRMRHAGDFKHISSPKISPGD